MTPQFIHIVILRDGRCLLELSLLRAQEFAEKHGGRLAKEPIGKVIDLVGIYGNPVETAKPPSRCQGKPL